MQVVMVCPVMVGIDCHSLSQGSIVQASNTGADNTRRQHEKSNIKVVQCNCKLHCDQMSEYVRC